MLDWCYSNPEALTACGGAQLREGYGGVVIGARITYNLPRQWRTTREVPLIGFAMICERSSAFWAMGNGS